MDKPNMPISITQVSAAVLNGNVYITGGTLGTTQQYFIKFNPTDNSYVLLAVPSVQRLNSKLVVFGNNIYCLGGHIAIPAHEVNNFDIYDVLSNTWSAFPVMPVGLTKLSATVKGNYLYAFGGSTYNGTFSTQYGYMAYDFTNNNWIVSTESMPNNTDQSAAVAVNDEIYIVNAVNSYKYYCDNQLNTSGFDNLKFIKIYPNPAKDILNINIPENLSIINCELFDISGKMIKAQIMNNSIDVSQLQKGMYLFRLETNEGILTEKFIKE